MSGHSKWSQIKRQKGVADINRGQIFTKIASLITIAVCEGGGVADPEGNFHLRLAIEKARTANMPKENIQRAIERGVKSGKEGGLEEVFFEGYGPGGVAVLVEATTDNHQRTMSEIKNIFEHSGGNLTRPGSVSFQFNKVGQITILLNDKSKEEIMLLAIDFGAQDLEEVGSSILVYTKPQDLMAIKNKILKAGYKIESAELVMRPTTTVTITDRELSKKVFDFMEKIEENSDVQKVYANFDIPDELL